jgi:hypothetical protein
MYELAAHPQREQAGGNVDVKDPAPAVVIPSFALSNRNAAGLTFSTLILREL